MYMYNHDLLSNVIDSFLLLFWSTKANYFSCWAPTRFPPLLFMFLSILCLTKYDLKKCYRMSKSLFKKGFSVKDRGSDETLGKIEANFYMYLVYTFDFGLR